ncbi:Iterative polyketide synthase CazM 11 [Colletotrichum musicola]|uniref:Iterative polyketide synthase CazM 11 n=1 Tax=Colletotrichum musicola TaxID=2175873 RepID=A0A8H6K7A7_9PEZI|nr:Iterative polyketide synthase CazM 11 [Colletotrichum musicola]
MSKSQTVLLFGPQLCSIDHESLLQTRQRLIEAPRSSWLLDTIHDLPTHWPALCARFRSINPVPTASQLEHLSLFFKTGAIHPSLDQLPNAILTPMVVLCQLLQYEQYAIHRFSAGGVAVGDFVAALGREVVEAVGFCTGLLSAFAVASSASQAELQQHGAAAIRIAMLIGALVDERETPSGNETHRGPSQCLSVMWNSPQSAAQVKDIVEQFSENAFISVKYDEMRATITVTESFLASLDEKLRDAGISTMCIGLKGRFHFGAHRVTLGDAMSFCDSQQAFQLPNASQAILKTRSNLGGEHVVEGRLHHVALTSILAETCDWHLTFSKTLEKSLSKVSAPVSLVAFGPERFIPPSFSSRVSQSLTHVEDLKLGSSTISPPSSSSPKPHQTYPQTQGNGYVAVVGMACKVAGADDVDELWDLLCKAESQHVEVTPDRIDFRSAWRDVDPERKWFGNFIRDPDAFDHKFFKKSPREAASQDPQQRQLLQVAYQAVEQSGYLSKPVPQREKRVGCYIGVVSTDYENNIACHAANAFSATGNLRSFIAGKVSHYFGWEAPSMTLDTACSASAVSVNLACNAILAGECVAALAGGTNIITNPLWFQNLAGASFLSPTGPCKPFDANADGYCRGEGVAAVFLKSLPQAIADGDQILGCIAATAVTQNRNCTPIFVPNAPSLSSLFDIATRRASLEPSHITVVEAHGTGTPVGDPAEYSSVLDVLGGSAVRSRPLFLGSIKGLIGHTESVSGVMSLIKVILMINRGYIPPQASFRTMSPHIKVSPSDMIQVPTSLLPWEDDFRAALINNYGASGSNAAMVVTQRPGRARGRGGSGGDGAVAAPASLKHPFCFYGSDDRSIRDFCGRLASFLKPKAHAGWTRPSLADVAFASSRQANPALARRVVLTCDSVDELETTLSRLARADASIPALATQQERPVVLCFGGQVSKFVGLDRRLHDSVTALRFYLAQCDSAISSLGLEGIYPDIFRRDPVEDTVKLQTMLFAMQYSCAKVWMDCGVEVAAVVGHSFGELTALCVSGTLSLRDAVKLVAGRSRVVRDLWGGDCGAMLAIEAELPVVEGLLADVNAGRDEADAANIACYNGPRSFTLAGSTAAIDRLQNALSRGSSFSGLRTKRLSVSNAFHSALVKPLWSDLELVGEGLSFKAPEIHLERSTMDASHGPLTASFVPEHMRNPVFFDHAVQRLAKRLPSCVFLEAGSNSTITAMANRALGSPAGSHFQAVNITIDNAWQNLVDTTSALWKEGVPVKFWAHHSSQAQDYQPILLPPYQFEKSRHWVRAKTPQSSLSVPVDQASTPEPPKGLFSFQGYQDDGRRRATFVINTDIPEYQSFVSGHTIAMTAPICPATLEVDMTVEAISSLKPDLLVSGFLPEIRGVSNQAPICLDPSKAVRLEVEATDKDSHDWKFSIVSSKANGTGTPSVCVSGRVVWRARSESSYQAEFARLGRLVPHNRCKGLLESDEVDDCIQGRAVYAAFAHVVDYGAEYRGLKRLVGRRGESAGRVVKRHAGKTWIDTHLSDCFSQVGGVWVNCMTDTDAADMYIANGFEAWMRSPAYPSGLDERPEQWDVFANHQTAADGKGYVTDIFVFDAARGTLLEVILGIDYHRVPKLSMSKLLSRMTLGSQQQPAPAAIVARQPEPKKPSASRAKGNQTVETSAPRSNVPERCRRLLGMMCGLDSSDIKDSSTPADLGIDSLMGMELAREIESEFKCSFPAEILMDISSVREMVAAIETVTGMPPNAAQEDEDNTASSAASGSQSDSDPGTPLTASSDSGWDIEQSLAEFLGIEKDNISPDQFLRDLGIDSLLSSELRSDVAARFDRHFAEDVSIEDLTVLEFVSKIDGKRAPKPAAATNAPLPLPTPTPVRAKTAHASSPSCQPLDLPMEAVLDAFGKTKRQTDCFIADHGCEGYLEKVYPKQTRLCVALTVEAFAQLGCFIAQAKPGQRLERIAGLPNQQRLVDHLYRMLEEDGRLIDVIGDEITRTSVAAPVDSSQAILLDLLRRFPDHAIANKLTHYAGTNLADVISGKTDGVKVIFGSSEGRELVAALYGDSALNMLSYKMMADFLHRLVSNIPRSGHGGSDGVLRILEMGAGTGGTTKWILPLLASLDVPVEYTFTDLSPGFVAAARGKFRDYPFAKYRVYDIEKTPADDLIGTQHIVIASNAIHATVSLERSLEQTRKFLRPDGFAMILEMTETLSWVDVIFGLFEGWWLFEDGRNHAIARETRWEKACHAVGFGHVDWTEGYLAESDIQRVFVAMASGAQQSRLPIDPRPPARNLTTDLSARGADVEAMVQRYAANFTLPKASPSRTSSHTVVLVTGASGSLGSHLVAHLSRKPGVSAVVCLNRPSCNGRPPREKQLEAFTSRGIFLADAELAKLQVVEADTSKPSLGLPADEYEQLVRSVTHIVHAAWPMSATRPFRGFENLFRALRNLVDFAAAASASSAAGEKISLLFVSSIAVVGHYPLWTGQARAPEERAEIKSVLPSGYSDAKLACERILDETLLRHPDRFRTMTARIGQIAGSTTSGYWNPVEHFCFLVKSSQTLSTFPDLDGVLLWCPVDVVAGTVADLVLADNTPYPIYHIDNPVTQPWKEMTAVLAEAIGVPSDKLVPMAEWLARVRRSPLSDAENPAVKLADFLEDHFPRMSCGGLILDTTKACEHSATLAAQGAIKPELARRYVKYWKEIGFLRLI